MTTLSEAKSWLRSRLDEGDKCPCCTQFAKVYERKINSGMARALIHQYRTVGQEVAHTASLCRFTHEAAQLAWWGLLEQDEERRADGGRSGWWRVTDLGRDFALNRVTVPKYARVYDGRLLSLVRSEEVSIVDAVGTKFNYHELMEGA
jgi:hypothetical protein